MKKTLPILGLLVITFSINAQQNVLHPSQISHPHPQQTFKTPAHHFQFDEAKWKADKLGHKGEKSLGTEYWLNYGVSINTLNLGNLSQVNSNYLFPDSLGYVNLGGGYAPVSINHIGDILDVKSPTFNAIDGVTWSTSTPYFLDSMSIVYGYTRNDPNTSIVDTLVVTLFTNSNQANLPQYYLTGQVTNFAWDTVGFKELMYNPSTNTVNATNTTVIKLPLTISDTAVTFYHEKMFGIPGSLSVPAGKLIACDVQFKPGYSYTLGDYIDTQHNAFLFASYEEQGNNTFPTYYPCTMGSNYCDYNCSFIVPLSVRYNIDTAWNGFFYPSYAEPMLFSLEHHLISYKVRTNNPPPLANFTMVADSANPLMYWAYNTTTGNGLTYNWTFGDGNSSILQSPVNTYASAGTYNVCLTISNGGYSNSICHTINVVSAANTCMALFNIAHDTASLDPNAYTVTDLSYGSNLTYLWDFGDTTTSTLQHPIHNYLGAGPYQLCLTVNNGAGCVQTYCDSLFAVDSLHTHLQPISFTVVDGPPPLVDLGVNALTHNSEIVISPNPFNSQTIISFSEEQKHTTIKITDVLGNMVMSLEVGAGRKEVVIEKGELSKGIYFVQITDSTKNVVNRKIVVQ
jgi:PKD repeat protein